MKNNNQLNVIDLLEEAREVLRSIDKNYTISVGDSEYIIGTHDIEIAKMLQIERNKSLTKE